MHRTRTAMLPILITIALGCDGSRPSDIVGPPALEAAERNDNPRSGRPASVTGSGHWTVDGELRTFAFHAIANDDGTAKGTFELHSRANDARLHGSVTCLTTFANQAWFGGVIENTTGPVGEVFWRIRDNGEGSDDAPDQVSFLFVNPTDGIAARYCRERPLTALNNIESGNVQVHPSADLSGAFTGTWAGTRFNPLGQPQAGFRWDLQQTGSEVSGLLFAPHSGCVQRGGCPVTGIVSGNEMQFEVMIPFAPPGTVERGTAIIDGNLMFGSLRQCNQFSCGPILTFRLTRQ